VIDGLIVFRSIMISIIIADKLSLLSGAEAAWPRDNAIAPDEKRYRYRVSFV
jgi:hypothetical protein